MFSENLSSQGSLNQFNAARDIDKKIINKNTMELNKMNTNEIVKQFAYIKNSTFLIVTLEGESILRDVLDVFCTYLTRADDSILTNDWVRFNLWINRAIKHLNNFVKKEEWKYLIQKNYLDSIIIALNQVKY